MTNLEFERLVVEALETIPKFFKDKLDNVDVVVENWPQDQLTHGRVLLGLYQGVPQTLRGQGYSLALPDKIIIFK